MANIIQSNERYMKFALVDLDALTIIWYSDWTGEFFPNEREANGVYAVYDDDEPLYSAIQEMVKGWECIEHPEHSSLEYRRKTEDEHDPQNLPQAP